MLDHAWIIQVLRVLPQYLGQRHIEEQLLKVVAKVVIWLLVVLAHFKQIINNKYSQYSPKF